MDAVIKGIIWRQFGAAIDMLNNAIKECPEDLWGDRSRNPEFWYVAYHTLFFLDYYLTADAEAYAPPSPFGLEELDPAGVLPARVYTKDELLDYLQHGRSKCKTVIENLTDERAAEYFKLGRHPLSIAELLVYTMRHVQHHAAQLNLLLRQTIDSAPRWVGQVRE